MSNNTLKYNPTCEEVLRSFLDKADEHYIAGRMLWFEESYSSFGHFMWLAIEQIIKVRITESILKKGRGALVSYLKVNSKKDKNFKSENNYELVNKSFKTISGHDIYRLDASLYKEFEICLKCYLEKRDVKHQEPKISLDDLSMDSNITSKLIGIPSLDWLNISYLNRYGVYLPTVTNMALLKSIDEIYLCIRSEIGTDFCQENFALLDRIILHKKFSLSQSYRKYHRFLFENNKSIKDNELNMQYGEFIYNTGENLEIKICGKEMNLQRKL